MTTFKHKFTFEQRKDEAHKIMLKHPDRIPVIVELSGKTSFQLDKQKFLVPTNLTIGQFMYVIRKRLKITPEKAIFFFCNNRIPASSTLINKLYTNHKDQDTFLYLNISEENVFG